MAELNQQSHDLDENILFLKCILFKNVLSLFMYFWERASRVGVEREGRVRIPNSLCSINTEPDSEPELIHREIMT